MLIVLLSNKERLCVLRKEVIFKQVGRYKVFFYSSCNRNSKIPMKTVKLKHASKSIHPFSSIYCY